MGESAQQQLLSRGALRGWASMRCGFCLLPSMSYIRLEKTDFLLDLFGKLAFRLLSLFYFVVELGTQFLLKVVEFALAVFHLIAKPE